MDVKTWRSLPQAWCFHKQGLKTGLCRFFGIIYALRQYREVWHTKLLAILFVALTKGWLAKGSLHELSKKLKVNVKEQSGKQSMKEGTFTSHHSHCDHSMQCIILIVLTTDYLNSAAGHMGRVCRFNVAALPHAVNLWREQVHWALFTGLVIEAWTCPQESHYGAFDERHQVRAF